MNLVDYRSAVDQELYEYRRARSATLQPNVMSEGHKKRAAAAAMVGMCAFKVGLSAFGPPFAELLLQRACEPLGLPYPGNATDDRCMQSDVASAVAARHTSVFNLATSIPQLVTVSLITAGGRLRSCCASRADSCSTSSCGWCRQGEFASARCSASRTASTSLPLFRRQCLFWAAGRLHCPRPSL